MWPTCAPPPVFMCAFTTGNHGNVTRQKQKANKQIQEKN